MSLIKVDSHKIGHCGYTFDNGVRLSVTFAPMTYSDNYDVWKKDEKGFETWQQAMQSTTVEVMQTDGNPAFNRWIHRHYSGYDGDADPIGYIPVAALPAILKRADSKQYKVSDLVSTNSKPTQTHTKSAQSDPKRKANT